ncbi:STAS domain-containing protein [Sphaerisporangium perillae]|uniref:STAS domain-containing protein n=1 Tax=Sphaerisporangium perillae TaxID=2935860 RepID=UPI00200BAAF3|nr:STAS domain-containing protein [Sphaerisporangium perillae]
MNSMEMAGSAHGLGAEPIRTPLAAFDRDPRITALVEHRGLRVDGDLDATTLPALIRALAAMGSSRDICVDLSGLTFIDVGSLRILVAAAARLEGDHVLTLRSASPLVRRLLDLTGWSPASGTGAGSAKLAAVFTRSPRDGRAR